MLDQSSRIEERSSAHGMLIIRTSILRPWAPSRKEKRPTDGTPHAHVILPDGLFVPVSNDPCASLRFAPLPAPTASAAEPQLLRSLHEVFEHSNPRIRTVRVLEVQPSPATPLGDEYALLATGWAPQRSGEVDFSDELFGVFVVDSTITKPLRILSIFPTQRWKDYWVRFERIGFDSLVVVGSGRAFGDQPMRLAPDWTDGESIKPEPGRGR